MNKIYGYWRCSTDQQDQERQIRALKDAGCEKIVGDKITGTSNYGDREELSTLLAEIQEGDLLILSELSRLGRTSLLMQIELDKLIKKYKKLNKYRKSNFFELKTLDGSEKVISKMIKELEDNPIDG